MNTTPIIENRIWQPEFECMQRSQLEQLQLKRLQQAVSRAAKNSFYKNLFQQNKVTSDQITSLEDLHRLPLTTKADLRDSYPLGFMSVPREQIVRYQGTSGTTGKPTWVAYTYNDVEKWSNLCARFLVSGGLKKEHTVQLSFGFGLFTGGFGLHFGIEKVGAAIIPISSGNSDRQLTCMKDLQPEILICTPSYALKLMDTLQNGDVDRSQINLEHAFFGGEPWTEDMRVRIEDGLNIKCWNNYGLAEVQGPGVSGECAYRNGMHIQEDQFLFEVIDPDTLEPLPDGERGEFVITPLCREGFPVIRYRTRDIGYLINDGPCPCGRTSRRMSRILGRTDDMLIIRGVNVFPSQIETALMQIDSVAPHYMIEVNRPEIMDTVTVHIEIKPDLFSDSMKEMHAVKKEIETAIRHITGLHMIINLVSPNTLKRFEGKAQRVIDHRNLVD